MNVDALPVILIIEDDLIVRDMLRMSLSARFELDIVLAESGLDALNKLKTLYPDVILLDLLMPEMDGFEFLGHFRQNAAWKNIPVIVLTAIDPTPAQRKYLEVNAQAVVRKGGSNYLVSLTTEIQKALMS